MSLAAHPHVKLLVLLAAAAAGLTNQSNNVTNNSQDLCKWKSTESLPSQECCQSEAPRGDRFVRFVSDHEKKFWTVNWKPVGNLLHDGPLFDVQPLRSPLLACARIGTYLVLLRYDSNSEEWTASSSIQVFPAEAKISLYKYPWLVTGDTIVIQTNYAMRFFQPSFDISKLMEVADPDTIFSAHLIMTDRNIVRMGNFYPNSGDMGILSKTEGNVQFHKVDLTERDEPLLRLANVDLDEIWSSNSTVYFIEKISSESEPDSFILIRDNVLAVYGFDDSYKLQKKLTTGVPLASGNGNIRIKFANLSGQAMKDLLIFNDLGLFVYQYRTVSNDYVLLDIDTTFSNRGPHNSHSISLVALTQQDGLAFSGSQGFNLFRFDLQSYSWHLVGDSIHYSSSLYSIQYESETTIFSQSAAGVIHWGVLKESKSTPLPLIPADLKEEKYEDFFNMCGKKLLVEQHESHVGKVKPDLRWAERWPDHFGKEAVNPANGAVSFELPLVNVTITPLLTLSVTATYDSLKQQQKGVGMAGPALLGTGWQLSFLQDFILIDRHQSIYAVDHKYYISREGVVLPLMLVDWFPPIITYSVNNDSSHTVVQNMVGNTWVYTHGKIQHTYGKCNSNADAVHWSLSWPLWQGAGTDLNALQQVPAAWYLCETRDTATDQSLSYHYHADWQSFPNGKKIVTSMRLLSITAGNGESVVIEYGEKYGGEFDEKNSYDDINKGYRFPTPLVDNYYVMGILTETPLFQQHLLFEYKLYKKKRVLTGLTQYARSSSERIIQWEYKNVGDFLVLSKYTSQNNFVVSYDYRPFKTPKLYAPVTDFPLFSDMKMAQGNDYIVTAYPNYLNRHELNVNVFNKIGTHSVDKFTVTASNIIEAFEVRALEQHLMFLLLTKQAMEVWKFANVDGGWASHVDLTKIDVNSTVSTFDGVVVYTSQAEWNGVHVLEWDRAKGRWNTTILPSPRLTRCHMQRSRIACYRAHQLWIFFKQNTWQQKIVPIDNNWTFSECDVLQNYNYSGKSYNEICDFMKQRGFQFEKNQVFSAAISMKGGVMKLRGLFILLNDRFEIARSQIVDIYSENVMDKRKEMEIPFDNGAKGKLYVKHAWSNGKIIMQVYDVGGKAFEKASSDERQHFMNDQNAMESWHNSSLIDWSNFTGVLGPHGVQLSDSSMYKVTGSSWIYIPKSQRDFVRLGRSLTLTSKDDKQFELLTTESKKVIMKFELADRGQMLNRYPEYIAYQSAEKTVELLTFANGDTLGAHFQFNNERIIFASGYHSLMTIGNTTTSLAFSTAQFYRVRPISSLQEKIAPPTAVLIEATDGMNVRKTGYESSFKYDRDNVVLTQTVAVIPAADKSVSGWVQQQSRFDLIKQNSSSKTFYFDSLGNELQTPERTKPAEMAENGLDKMGEKEILWDKSGEWEISNFFPYSLVDDESDYFGFEDYEKPRKWKFNAANVVRNQFSFTGRNFLSLKVGHSLSRNLTPSYQDGTFIASCWIRSNSITFAAIGKPTKIFSAQITTNSYNGTDIIKMLAETKRMQGLWYYLEIRIDFRLIHEIYKAYVKANYDKVHVLPAPEIDEFQIKLKIVPDGESYLGVDHVRFSPVTHEFSANVYDMRVGAITERISSNGLVTRTMYNNLGQRLVSIGETGQVEEMVTSSYTARFFNHSGSLCSRQITIIPFRGFAENFDELSFEKRWRTSSANKFAVAPCQLIHKDTNWHSIEAASNLIRANSAMLRLQYSLFGQKSGLKLAWRGSSIYFNRDGENCFVESSNSNKQRIPLAGELIFFLNNERILALVDGIEVMDKYQDNQQKRALQISLFGEVLLENLVVAEEPQMQIQYQNGWGEVEQVIQIEYGSSIRITETLYDELGRGAITTKTTRVVRHFSQPLIAMVRDFVENRATVWKVGKMTGMVDKLNPNDNGYPYTTTEYYTNPLNQKKSEGLPGSEFSTRGKFKKQFRTDSKIDFITNIFPSRFGFRQETIIEPNESVQVSVFDKNNNNVAKYTLVPGFGDILSTYEYNNDRKLVKILPPLYHEKLGTFSRTEPWQSGNDHLTDREQKLQDQYGTFFTFDENGNLVKKRTPDAGIVEYLYNSRGYMRFSFTINLANNLTDSLTYYEHDLHGQITETGQISIAISRSDLSSYLESKYIPGKKSFQQTDYYDSHPDPDLRGRAQTVLTQTGDCTIIDRIVYNADREVTTKSTVPLIDSASLEAPTSLNKTYLGKKLHVIHYPVEIGGNPLKLIHSYNGAGQLVSLGMGDRLDLFLTFSYHGSGTLAVEQYNVNGGAFTRRYEYNSPGYLQSISDPFLDQSTTYTTGGYGQAGFGDGIIMSTTFKPHWHAKANPLHFSADVLKLPTSKYSAMCLNYLRGKGYVNGKNVPVKNFQPNQVTDLPLLCRGALANRLAKLLAEVQPANTYGHCYAYGNHKELVKAKYFASPESQCSQPLQPLTFSMEISRVTPSMSIEIFQVLNKADFLVADRIRYNMTYTTSTPGLTVVRFDDIKSVLNSFFQQDYTLMKFINSIELMIKHAVIREEPITLQKFQNYLLIWDKEPGKNATESKSATALYKALKEKKLLPTAENTIEFFDRKFLSSLSKYRTHIPQIARVLLKKFENSIGSSPFDVISFDIDANGNHRKFTVGYETYDLKYLEATNKIDVVTLLRENKPVDFVMRHDSKGNVIQAMHRSIVDISYCPTSQRTRSITLQDGRRLFFFYDAKGERVLKQVVDPAGRIMHEKHYLRDDEGRVLVERSIAYNPSPIAPDTLLTAYIYGPRGLVGFVRNDQFFSVTTDHIGSVRLVVLKGRVVAAYDYLPYGQLMRQYSHDPVMQVAYRYTGQEFDEETGLYNYHARLYDPSIGRFFQPDPQAQYFSPYKYAGNSPVALFDPDGEFAFLLVALAFAVIGAYVGGAAANGTWNIAKWKWDTKTVLGVLLGAVTGFFLPYGFAATFAVLAPVMGGFLAATTVTILGIGGAYMMGAVTQGLNPLEWKWSEPEIWNEMFSGFATGSGLIGGLKSVHTLGDKAAKWASSAKRLAIIQKFSRVVKPVIIGSSYLSGAAVAYTSAMASNENSPAFWQWDWSDVKTWAGLINGFDAGSGLPENFISIGSGLTKSIKNRKNLLTTFNTVSASKVKGLFKALTNRKSAFFKTASAALMAWAMGSNANGDFFDWNWKSFGTYQGIFNGAFAGKGIAREVSTRATKAQMKAFAKSFKISAKNSYITARNLISRILHSVRNFHKNIGLRGIEIMRKLAQNIDFNAGLRKGFIDTLTEVGNSRGRKEGKLLSDTELKAVETFHESAMKAEQESNRIFVDEDVDFMSCKKRSRRRKRADGLMDMCSLLPFVPEDESESSQLYIKNRENRNMIQAVLDKTPKAHSANNIIFYPQYVLGGVNVHLRTEDHTISDGFLHQKFEEVKEKPKKNQSFDQTIVLLHEPDARNNIEVTIKKMVTDTLEKNLADYQRDWENRQIVDVNALKTLLMAKGVTDFQNVHINGELTVLYIKRRDGNDAAQHTIHFTDGFKQVQLLNLQNLRQPVSYNSFYSKAQTPNRLLDLQTHVRNYLDNNEGSQNYGVQMEAARDMTRLLLEMYHETRKSQGLAGTKPKEAEFHAFFYGALEMNLKRKYNSDVIVESVVGKGELDMVLFFRKDTANVADNWQSVPILFELKSGDASKRGVDDNFRDFPGLKVEGPSEGKGDASAYYPSVSRGSIQQITRKGYLFNLPLKTVADTVIIIGVDSFLNIKPNAAGHFDHAIERTMIENSVQVGLLKVPKYEGLVDHLVSKSTANSLDIIEQMIKQYYSYSPYSNKKREIFNENSRFGAQERVDPSTYMGCFALGEVMSRPREAYVNRARSERDPMVALFKGDGDVWVLLQLVDGRKGIKGEVIVPDHVPLDQITSLRIEAQKELVDTNERMFLYNDDPMKPLHAPEDAMEETSFVRIDPIDASPLLSPAGSNSSPFEPILKSLESQLKKLPNSYVDEGDLQAILQGALIGNQGIFQANKKDLRVRPESSLTALGRIDLLVTVTDNTLTVPRDQYLNVVEMKYVKTSEEPDGKRQKPNRDGSKPVDRRMVRELMVACQQTMNYFNQNHLQAVTEKNIVEGTVVVANDKGDIYYAIMEVKLGKKPHNPPEFRLKVSNAILSLPNISRNRRDLPQLGYPPATKQIENVAIENSVNEAALISRQRVLEIYNNIGQGQSSSSASRAQLWPIQFIKSIFSTLSIAWSSSSYAGSKRSINRLLIEQTYSKVKSHNGFSVLDMGDAWLAETNLQGNLLWFTIAMYKLTGNRPFNNADPYNLTSQQHMQLMHLLASELTYEMQAEVCRSGTKCGITPVVSRLMHQVDIAAVREAVYRKLLKSHVDEIGSLLFSELVEKYRDRVAMMSTRKQADKWTRTVLRGASNH